MGREGKSVSAAGELLSSWGLTAKQVAALSAYYCDGLSYGEIAKQLGISASSVKRLILRGKDHIEKQKANHSDIRDLSKPTFHKPQMIATDPAELDKRYSRDWRANNEKIL